MTTTVIDVNPDVLRQSAEAALHAARQSWAHLNSELEFEKLGQVETVMATLVGNEPYSFISSGGEDDGPIGLESEDEYKPWIAVTRDSVFKHYTRVHGTFVIEGFDPLLELRGNWYTQFESLTTLGIKATGDSIQMINLVLLASGAGKGITGEISAVIDPEATRAAARAGGVNLEQQRYERTVMHDRYRQALLSGDVEGVLEVLGEGAQSLVRDYVDDTGALTNLDGPDAHRDHYTALFEKYRIESADVIHRVSQDSYLFAELRVNATPRTGSNGSSPIAFNTAEWFTYRENGALIRMGHGTDIG